MKTLYSIILTITAFAGCAKSHSSSNKTDIVVDSLTYLALGDSYTIGEAINLAQAFPYQLVNQLNYSKPCKPLIIARTGWTTDELITAINQASISKTFDFVTLLIGVNNQFRGYSQATYRQEFTQLLNTAIKFANGNKTRVFVLSIPDYGVTPFANGDDSTIGPQIDGFNAINKDESNKAGVNYLDITAISKKAATDASLIAPDGLHPSAKMYELWVQQLTPMVKAQLSK